MSISKELKTQLDNHPDFGQQYINFLGSLACKHIPSGVQCTVTDAYLLRWVVWAALSQNDNEFQAFSKVVKW